MTKTTLKPVTIDTVRNVTDLSESEYYYYYRLATPDRKRRADRFMHREDACRSLVGEALVRFAAWTRTGTVLDAAMLATNEFGRPFIRGLPFYYNVAHSGAWVVCAADQYEVGVDVEKKHAVDLGIANRFFTPEETGIIRDGATEDEQYALFFWLWVCKESYIKALGRGFSCPLNTFGCIPDDADGLTKLHVLDGTLPIRYFQSVQLPDSDYPCAVCTLHPDVLLTLTIWSPDELLQRLSFLEG